MGKLDLNAQPTSTTDRSEEVDFRPLFMRMLVGRWAWLKLFFIYFGFVGLFIIVMSLVIMTPLQPVLSPSSSAIGRTHSFLLRFYFWFASPMFLFSLFLTGRFRRLFGSRFYREHLTMIPGNRFPIFKFISFFFLQIAIILLIFPFIFRGVMFFAIPQSTAGWTFWKHLWGTAYAEYSKGFIWLTVFGDCAGRISEACRGILILGVTLSALLSDGGMMKRLLLLLGAVVAIQILSFSLQSLFQFLVKASDHRVPTIVYVYAARDFASLILNALLLHFFWLRLRRRVLSEAYPIAT